MAQVLATSLMGVGIPSEAAKRLGNTVSSKSGVGTTQGGTSPVLYNNEIVLFTPTGSNTAGTLHSGVEVGGSVVVFNVSTSVTATIFPPSSGTIDGGSANASVLIGPLAGRMFFRSSSTAWWTIASGVAGGIPVESATNGITAFAGGGQGSAVALTTAINRVTTVGTAADSVKLPAATVGLRITVINAAAANSMNIFPASGDIINALSANAAIACAANKTMTFTCAVAGTWNSMLTA